MSQKKKNTRQIRKIHNTKSKMIPKYANFDDIIKIFMFQTATLFSIESVAAEWAKFPSGRNVRSVGKMAMNVCLKLKFHHRICQLMCPTYFVQRMIRSGRPIHDGQNNLLRFCAQPDPFENLFSCELWKGFRLFFIWTIMCALDHISYYRALYSFCAFIVLRFQHIAPKCLRRRT